MSFFLCVALNITICLNKRFVHYRLRASSTVHTMNLLGKLDKMDAYRDRMLLCLAIGNKKLLQGIAHDYSVGLMNLYLLADKQNDKEVENNIIYKAKEILRLLSKSIGLKEKLLLIAMINTRSIFIIIYSTYRKKDLLKKIKFKRGV